MEKQKEGIRNPVVNMLLPINVEIVVNINHKVAAICVVPASP